MSRYLIVAAQGLGDALESTPMLEALRTYDVDAEIDVAVTRNGPAQLFAGLRAYVNDVIYLPYWESGSVAFGQALLRERRGRSYDKSFLAFPAARPAYRVILGAFRSKQRFAHDWNFGLLDRVLGISPVAVRKVHNVERNGDLLRAALLPDVELNGYLTPPAWKSPIERNKNRIAMHVGSVSHDGLAAKRWPLESFAELGARLRKSGYEVVMIAGPDELEETRECANRAGGLAIHRDDLPGTARFLSACAATVANDNGIAHLAAGVGTPVVAIFGPTPTEFGPFAANAISLRPSLCPPCFDVRHPVVTCVRNIDFACLKRDVTVERVFSEVVQCASLPS